MIMCSVTILETFEFFGSLMICISKRFRVNDVIDEKVKKIEPVLFLLSLLVKPWNLSDSESETVVYKHDKIEQVCLAEQSVFAKHQWVKDHSFHDDLLQTDNMPDSFRHINR